MNAMIPLFYFKPTICWIDDDPIFLDAINLSYKECFKNLTFDDPRKALQFFKGYQSPLLNIHFKREFKESDIFGTNDHYPVDINIPAIKNLLTLENKGQEIAVLVIDYNMPGMNGVELCKQLKGLPIKKILLTGEAAQEKAIEAFNLGLIDKFIKKDHGVAELLQEYINELICQFFYDKTADLISHIEVSKPSLLTDERFIQFFNNWCHENHILEYYLINQHGSFLVKDKDANQFYFVVMSESDKAEFIHLNDELSDVAGDLLSKTSEGKVIPFFGCDKESWDIDAREWKDYFFPSQMISGRENYYWSVLNFS